MIKPDLIIKSNRRSVSISISKEGKIIVRAPKKLGVEYILSILCEKEKWIKSKLNQIENQNSSNRKFKDYSEFLFCGVAYKPLFVEGIKKVEINNKNLICPKNLDEKKELKQIKKWYIKISLNIILNRVEYFANLMQLDYKSLSISDTKRRWGSCDREGKIKINFRVVMLPHKLIDYIVIHELSHLVEFNHSVKFYNLIESVMSDYKTYRKQLKGYTYLLELLR